MYGSRRASGRLWRAIKQRPIDATKNMVYLDVTVPTLTVTVLVLSNAVKRTLIDDTVPTRVAEDCTIKGFNIQFRLVNRTNNLPGQEKVVIFIRRNQGGLLPAPTLAACNSLGLQPWRNMVFATTVAKPGGPDSLPMVMGGIRIPRRFHKQQVDDQWELIIANSGGGSIDGCGIAIYKWYS